MPWIIFLVGSLVIYVTTESESDPDSFGAVTWAGIGLALVGLFSLLFPGKRAQLRSAGTHRAAAARAPGSSSQPVLLAEVDFTCSLCGKEAGRLFVWRIGDDKFQLIRESFTSRLTAKLTPNSVPGLIEAFKAKDVQRLYAMDLENTPFYCPKCDRCYCADHWVRWDVFDEDEPHWHDSIRGKCPQGHERMLED